MKKDILAGLSRFSDAELVGRLKSLVGRERHATALIVAHLAELEVRDVHLRAGYSSLFAYCRDVLGFSDGEAGNRSEVAGAARRFPVILELLASGAVNLTAVRLLAPHLTEANHLEVLESARGKTTFQVREIVARLSPRPDVPTVICKLPAPWPESPSQTGAALVAQTGIALAPAVEAPAPPPPVPPPGTRT